MHHLQAKKADRPATDTNHNRTIYRLVVLLALLYLFPFPLILISFLSHLFSNPPSLSPSPCRGCILHLSSPPPFACFNTTCRRPPTTAHDTEPPARESQFRTRAARSPTQQPKLVYNPPPDYCSLILSTWTFFQQHNETTTGHCAPLARPVSPCPRADAAGQQWQQLPLSFWKLGMPTVYVVALFLGWRCRRPQLPFLPLVDPTSAPDIH